MLSAISEALTILKDIPLTRQLAALRNHPAIAPQLLSDISDLVIS